MASSVIENYFNTLKHLKIASLYLNDIALIEQELRSFEYNSARNLTSYLANRHKKDLNEIGKFFTGVMVFKENQLPVKTSADLINDLLYIQDCIIVSAAVHCGIENTIKSALIKIDRENKKSVAN